MVQELENYRKGKNVEEPFTRENIPLPNLPQNFIWMHVHGGSKMRNLLDAAIKGYSEQGTVLWSGAGAAISKTISCAEVLKRRFKAHQITKISYRKAEEYWEPLHPELDELVVVREEPVIHILLSQHELDNNELGYQSPGNIDACFNVTPGRTTEHNRKSKKQPRVSSEQATSMGLRRKNPKKSKVQQVESKS